MTHTATAHPALPPTTHALRGRTMPEGLRMKLNKAAHSVTEEGGPYCFWARREVTP